MIKIKRKIKNLIPIAVFALGVGFLLLPKYKDYQSEKRTQEMLAEIEEQYPEITDIRETGELTGVDTAGMLVVADKIDLKMPLVNDATFENMIDSVATIRHSTIEEGKNLSIAGHRYIRYGRHFNRIDELVEGDEIVLYGDGVKYVYNVSEKLVVEPENIDVLDDSGETEITLVTCHPPGISSHRLVVKGKLKNN